MVKFDNPFDISKDRQNPFIDGVRFHIRESDLCKDRIKEFIQKNDFEYFCLYKMSALEILTDAMKILNIRDDDLIISDEHELLDWIKSQLRN